MKRDLKKYYQPDISEFHVGFEYEYKLGAYDKGLKTKEEFDSKDWEIDVFDGQHFPYLDRALNGLNTERDLCHIRVKYLDREDIESLGFFCHASDERVFHNKNGIIINIGWGSPVKEGITLAVVSPVFDESKMNIIHEHYLFNGTIKNKSELKKLLKQLGIN